MSHYLTTVKKLLLSKMFNVFPKYTPKDEIWQNMNKKTFILLITMLRKKLCACLVYYTVKQNNYANRNYSVLS